MISEDDPNLSCVVLRILRALCHWDQKQLALALGMNPKRLSAIESPRTTTPPARDLLVRAAQVMELPESLIDEAFAFLRRVTRAQPVQAPGLRRELAAIAQRTASQLGDAFLETTAQSSREALAATERAIGDYLWRLLAALPEPERRRAVEAEAMFHRWGLVERLWNESLTAAADDHRKALALAELARAAAERIAEGTALRSRMEGLAWSGIANARRVGGELLLADRDFARAKVLWAAGEAEDQGLFDEARFLGLEASLRRNQRRFDEALACIKSAQAKARPGAKVEFLVAEGHLQLQLQRQEDAAQLYLEAIGQSGPETPPRLSWVARFAFVECLCDLGRPEQAITQLPELRETALQFGNGLDLLRVRWLEGRAEAAFGRNAVASEILGVVRDSFLARGILFDAALAGLERAALQLEAGRVAEVRAGAPELADTFKKLGVAPELLASLTLFCAAAQAGMATANEARQILALLRQASTGGPPREAKI